MLKLSSEHIGKLIRYDSVNSLRAVRTPSAGKILAKLLMLAGVVIVVFIFLPWQQNIRGTGKVTALNPAHRPQNVQAVIAGQIVDWHIQEGQLVNRGDTIVTIREVKEKFFDPDLLIRIKEQLTAKQNGLTSKKEKSEALKRQKEALIAAMNKKIEQAEAKLAAEKIKYSNTENLFTRNKKLFDAGNIPLSKFQDIESKYSVASADLENAKVEIDRLKAEYGEKISKTESDLNSTEADIFETQSDISKITNEYANMQIRSEQYQILAPQKGFVVRAMKAGIGETIKEGETICTVVPFTEDHAVEMFVKAMDVPLISKGRRVRVQFDGWPALQVSGWPNVSVGSFGGIVEVIDYASSRPGEFRILVTPDKNDEPWPPQLRVGSGTKGWVMLDDVPLWYEIWRQLNGFPPSLYDAPLDEVVGNERNGSMKKEKSK